MLPYGTPKRHFSVHFAFRIPTKSHARSVTRTPFRTVSPRTPVNKGEKKRKNRTESSSRALQDAG
jgi:hypothetical protein